MTHDEWIETIEAEFFDTVIKARTLDDLTDCAYSFLGNPLMLTNERGEIYSKSKFNRPYNDLLWEEFDVKGYVPREKRPLLSVEVNAGQLQNDRLVVYDAAYISHRLMMYQTKVSDTFTLRAMMLEAKKPFSADDEVAFELFAKTAAYYLRATSLVREFNSSSFEFFLHELLSGHIDSEKNETDIASYLFVRPDDSMVMLVFGRRYGDVAPTSMQEVRNGLQELFENSVSFIFEGNVVLFINLREQGDKMIRQLGRAAAYMRRNKLYCGVSRRFDSFHYVPQLYRQTADCCRLGSELNPKGTVFYVGDIMVTYMLNQLIKDELGSLRYLPALELLDFQREEYMPTLYAYTITLGNIAQTARLLGVHYNTVKYRIQKIGELLGVSPETILPALYITIKVLFLTDKMYMDGCFDMELVFRQRKGEVS